MIRLLITIVNLTVLTAVAIAQGRPTTPPPKSEQAAITVYAKSLDQYTKHNPGHRRLFGNAAELEDEQDKWRSFKTAKQLDQANLYESAYVWLKDGKVVTARFNFTSPSGDWSHYVNYYFRADGTLAKIHAQLNTFASAKGGVSVIREKFYDTSGKLLHESTRYLDLKTQRPGKRIDFMDQPIPVYKTVRDAPFAKLLRS